MTSIRNIQEGAVTARSRTAIWWQTLRPRTLPAAVGPVLLGQALVAPGYFSWLTAVLCLVCAMSLQIAVNLANDLFDGLSGVDQPDRLGPTRAMESGLLSAVELRRGLGLTLAIAVGVGLCLAVIGHWSLWLLGGLSLLGVLGYSGGRRPYANLGLGEVAVWLFFGPVAVLGSLLAQQSPIPAEAILAAILMGLPVAAILVVNNLRDRYTDARAGKLTLAVRLGPRSTRLLFTILTMAPLVMTIPIGLSPWLWGVWGITGLVALMLTGKCWQNDGKALNPVLGQTALYSLAAAAWLGVRFVVALP